MAIIIAGERSGVGKTTVTLAMLAALKARSRYDKSLVQSFKVGPDYIDPMFHTHITGMPCRNLDPVLTSETYVRWCFARHSRRAEYALIEGVMGLFDGASGSDDTASTAHIAKLLGVPVVLILNCASTSRSIAAIAHGYRTFDPQVQIAGVILNRVGSDRHLELLTQALEPVGLPILGVLRRQDLSIPDRHLGLVPTAEMDNLQELIERLANLGETCFDWDKLLPLMRSSHTADFISNSDLEVPEIVPFKTINIPKIRIAIAQDRAFSFYYADNLDLLTEMGAELVPWSPMQDADLPEQVQGLYFGGGFPEVFAAELAANHRARTAVKLAIESGIPTYAECGGLMYLCDRIVNFEEQSFPMVGALPTIAKMGKRLYLGYRQAIALQNSPMLQAGDRIWGHEFHRSALTTLSDRPLYSLQGYDSRLTYPNEGWCEHHIHASYVHVHFGAQTHMITNFLQQANQYHYSNCH
ncbi:MAG: cobyrinate a,c-diamide synthase [Pseudanabaenaceae cyanobacterium bins.39]|nr:cobyrinate a,c-diamide synthase [Pseudanabaenaceae cyanobacterium bins.39]